MATDSVDETPPADAGETAEGTVGREVSGGGTARRPAPIASWVLLVGLIVTGALTWTSLAVYNRNEDRLVRLRVRELGLVLSGALPGVQTPLASAAALANATHGNPGKFRAFVSPYVGPTGQFALVSLWASSTAQATPVAAVGSAPKLTARGRAAFFRQSAHRAQLSVTGMLSGANPRLGYTFSTPGVRGGYIVYAEAALPTSRRSRLESDSGFADLDYALYLGTQPRQQELLVTNIGRFPITGRQASEQVRFGDSRFTLVVTPNGSLGGAFFQRLPWIVATIGVLLALAAAVMTGRLARRRRQAEHLAVVLEGIATENRSLYAEQRSIAQELQHALLPEDLPVIPGLDTSARYVAAASGVDVGGDWYDIVTVDESHVVLIVGDVSGHGLRAATTMASVRFAALAYTASNPQPAAVLTRLSNFVNGQPHEYFATVVCALVDIAGRSVTVASAGHLPPLLVDADGGRFVEIRVGVPIGVRRDAAYQEVSVTVAPEATLIAFTDGLVERRGEILDVGLERLREMASRRHSSLHDLVATLADELASADHDDDTAIVSIRWQP
jgi:serine phosphatase RsbU (regulator of sigma subunit)